MILCLFDRLSQNPRPYDENRRDHDRVYGSDDDGQSDDQAS